MYILSGTYFWVFELQKVHRAKRIAWLVNRPLHMFSYFQTLFAAWQVGALSNTYLQSSLEKFTTQMSDIENHHLAPPGWRAVWDRYDPFSFYFFSLRHFLWKIRSWKFREINELMWNLLLTRVEIEMLETIIGNQSGDQKFDNPGLKSRAW